MSRFIFQQEYFNFFTNHRTALLRLGFVRIPVPDNPIITEGAHVNCYHVSVPGQRYNSILICRYKKGIGNYYHLNLKLTVIPTPCIFATFSPSPDASHISVKYIPIIYAQFIPHPNICQAGWLTYHRQRRYNSQEE